MMRLRPYKPCDGDKIASWLTDERTFAMWSAYRYNYPMTGEQFNERMNSALENPCEWMMTAIDESGEPVGHFLLRGADYERNSIRIGFIIVDSSKRGMGYGSQMLELAKKYCFEVLGMNSIGLGVYDINGRAKRCYEKMGFKAFAEEDADFEFQGERWKVIEMECLKQEETL